MGAAIAVVSTFHKDIKPLIISPIFEIELSGGTKRNIDTADPKEKSLSVMRFALNEDIATLRSNGRIKEAEENVVTFQAKTQSTVNELYDMADKLRGDAALTLFKGALSILLPPLVLLLLGLSVRWIVRGFRQKAVSRI